MRKCLKLLSVCLLAAVFTAAGASAEEFFASDFEGAIAENNVVTISDTEAEVIYEWYAEKSGYYNVSFPDAVSSGCVLTLSVNDGYPIRISDISRSFVLGFESGINKLKISTKKTDTGSFSVGKIKLEYASDFAEGGVHLEADEKSLFYENVRHIYYDDYGSDMSNRDVILMQTGRKPDIEFAVYAPTGGEYAAKAVLSRLGQTFTSDICMSVNGKEYPLTADTMARLKDLTNASDLGLMKLYSANFTVTLKKGMNTISFKAIEKRDAGDLYIFFLDCVDFSPVNEVIEINPNVSAAGEYSYSVTPARGARYTAEVTLIFEGTLHRLPECLISGDGVSYVSLDKNSDTKIVSEYFEDGKLYGVYRTADTVSPNGKLYVKIGSGATLRKISLIPQIDGVGESSAGADRVILLPGDTAQISVFAEDNGGYALNLNDLRKTGGMTFKSTNREILAADALGKVTALKPGIAYVEVSVFDGTSVKTKIVEFDIYDEKFGFTVLSAENDGEYVRVKLLSPFGTKSGSHTAVIAEFDGGTMVNATSFPVNGLEKGQVVTLKVSASKNNFKVISLSDFASMRPVYDVITAREVR